MNDMIILDLIGCLLAHLESEENSSGVSRINYDDIVITLSKEKKPGLLLLCINYLLFDDVYDEGFTFNCSINGLKCDPIQLMYGKWIVTPYGNGWQVWVWSAIYSEKRYFSELKDVMGFLKYEDNYE